MMDVFFRSVFMCFVTQPPVTHPIAFQVNANCEFCERIAMEIERARAARQQQGTLAVATEDLTSFPDPPDKVTCSNAGHTHARRLLIAYWQDAGEMAGSVLVFCG